MRRAVLIAALGFSGAVHALLVPEHLREMPLLGVMFIPAAAASALVAAALVIRPADARLRRLAATLLGGELLVYGTVVAAGVEPVESVALVCKSVEIAGLLAAVGSGVTPRRRRAVVAGVAGAAAGLAATAALAAPSMSMPGSLPERSVDIPGRSYNPGTLIAVVGQAVTWQNNDSTGHTVTADGGGFDSGTIPPGGTFSWTALRPGTYAYHCSIHRFMHGEIDVYDLALTGPVNAIAPGSPFTLRGIAQTPGAVVTLTDAGGNRLDATTAAADGSFAFTLTAETPGIYRAASGSAASPPYTLALAARPVLTLESAHAGRYRLGAAATPEQPGATVALQQYVPERFAWRTIQRRRLDAASHATFTLRARTHLHVRLSILAAVAGYRGGLSRELRLP